MRAVVQRVKHASVSVENNVVGQINGGLLVYLGIGKDDTHQDLEYLVNKVLGLRIFSDDNGQMNLSVVDVGQSILLVSQFTLWGDVRKGKRPSFASAMEPGRANEMYETFAQKVRGQNVTCAQGTFGAMMDIESVNDGPVTILLDSQKVF